MVIDKNRSAKYRLSSKERKQLLLWGSILILAMIGLIYLITPSANPTQQPDAGQKQNGAAKNLPAVRV
jgi:hypothetical protein